MSRALKRVDQLERQVEGLRETVREERRRVAKLERKLERLRLRAAKPRTGGEGDADDETMSPQAIRKLRGSLPRIRFAKLVAVSPGSIFGWETGRTTPRGRSQKRLIEIEKLGLPGLGESGGGGSKKSRRASKGGRRSRKKQKRSRG